MSSQRDLISKTAAVRLTLAERCESHIPLRDMHPSECCVSPHCSFCTDVLSPSTPPPSKKAKVDSPSKDDYWNVLPLPPELHPRILNYAAIMKAKDRLKEGWDLIHHALQPCSVCGKLLAIKTDEHGEIVSSGKCPHFIFHFL